MKSYDNILKEKSLDELLQESRLLQQKSPEIIASEQAKDNSLVSGVVNERAKEVIVYSGNGGDYGLDVKTSATAVGRMGYKAAKGIFDGTIGFGKFLGYCFTLPSSIKRLTEKEEKGISLNELEKAVLGNDDMGWFPMLNLFGGVAGSFVSIIEIFGGDKVPNSLSYPAFAYFTTNALSGLYEWFRYEKNKLKNKREIENGK